MKEYIKDLDFNTVISRLKQGQILQSDESKTTVEMIDGILVERKDNDFSINPNIYTRDVLREWYFERPKPQMEIIIGKFYTTRDGKKAYVFAKNSAGKYNVAIEGEGAYSVFEGGYYSEEEETQGDLVSAWDVKKNIKVRTGQITPEKREKIKELLKKDWSYKDMAKELGVSYSTVAAYVYRHREDLQ